MLLVFYLHVLWINSSWMILRALVLSADLSLLVTLVMLAPVADLGGDEKANKDNTSHIVTDTSSEVSLEMKDIFCSIIKMGYGKGGRDPVSELTAFYCQVKNSKNSSSSDSAKAAGESGGGASRSGRAGGAGPTSASGLGGEGEREEEDDELDDDCEDFVDGDDEEEGDGSSSTSAKRWRVFTLPSGKLM